MLVRMCSEKRAIVCREFAERHRVAGQLREAEVADRGVQIEQPRDDRGRPGICRGLLIEDDAAGP